MSKRKYTEQELREAVASSFSFRQTLSKLSLREAGGNYKIMRKLIKEFEINHDHFTGQAHLKGKKNLWHPITPLENILVDGSCYQTFKLKNRLLKAGLLEKRCYMEGCCITQTWNGKPINLRLDHINGKNDDNRLENLRLLCPNCDSQLETFCGRNKRKKKID